MNNELLAWLQEYYSRLIDGDWEHGFGISMATLDNPGWIVEFGIDDTEFESLEITRSFIEERSENNWIHIKIVDDKLQGACGPNNLIEMLEIVKSWHEEAVQLNKD